MKNVIDFILLVFNSIHYYCQTFDQFIFKLKDNFFFYISLYSWSYLPGSTLFGIAVELGWFTLFVTQESVRVPNSRSRFDSTKVVEQLGCCQKYIYRLQRCRLPINVMFMILHQILRKLTSRRLYYYRILIRSYIDPISQYCTSKVTK